MMLNKGNAPMSELSTRQATTDDLTHIQHLAREQRQLEHHLDPRLRLLPDEATADGLQAAVMDGSVWVAMVDNVCRGFIWLRDEGQVLHVVYMVLDAHYEGRGIGTALFDVARSVAQAQDASAITAYVPRSIAVQQAFWRAQSASVLQELVMVTL